VLTIQSYSPGSVFFQTVLEPIMKRTRKPRESPKFLLEN
jgi:hypothetical protein